MWVLQKSLTVKATIQQLLRLATPGCRDKLSKSSSHDRQNCFQKHVTAATTNLIYAITHIQPAKPVSFPQYSSPCHPAPTTISKCLNKDKTLRCEMWSTCSAAAMIVASCPNHGDPGWRLCFRACGQFTGHN